MAEVVDDSFIPIERTKGKTRWDQFLDGQTWRLVRGVDYNIQLSAIQMLTRAARAKGKRIRTSREGDGVFYVRAFDREAKS